MYVYDFVAIKLFDFDFDFECLPSSTGKWIKQHQDMFSALLLKDI